MSIPLDEVILFFDVEVGAVQVLQIGVEVVDAAVVSSVPLFSKNFCNRTKKS